MRIGARTSRVPELKRRFGALLIVVASVFVAVEFFLDDCNLNFAARHFDHSGHIFLLRFFLNAEGRGIDDPIRSTESGPINE